MRRRRARLTSVVLLAYGCSSQSPPAPSNAPAARSEAPRWSGWSSTDAIATCVGAVDEARLKPPELENARSLMATCSSLVGGEQCRSVTRRQWGSPPTPTFDDAVRVCAKEYCPRLAEASSLRACSVQGAPEDVDAGEAWIELRRAMLLHDFPESDLAVAARAMLAATDYLRSVPPPSLGAESASSPLVEVRLASNGAFSVVQDGRDLVTVSSIEELSSALPQPPSETRISLRAGADVPYERLVAVMNALRNLGYEQLSFAVGR